jgi:hypothetical protein
MPRRQPRLSTRQEAEYRRICNKLQNLGIQVNAGATAEPKPRFKLEPIHPCFARVHDLPNGSAAFTLPARLTVFSSVMITDALVWPEWDEGSADLEDPRDHRDLNNFLKDFPTYSPKILNDLLVGRTHPVERCRYEGLLIAIGWTRVPPTYSDEKLVNIELRLRYEQDLAFSCNFVARVDRSLKYKYERTRPTPELIMQRLSRRVSAYQREEVAPTNQVPGQVRRERDKSSDSPERTSWCDITDLAY